MQNNRIAKRVSALAALGILALAAAVLIGCGDSSRLVPRFLIAPDSGVATGEMNSFSVTPATGALSAVSGSPFSPFAAATTVSDIVSNGSHFVFALDTASNKVGAASVDSAGKVTAINSVPLSIASSIAPGQLVLSGNCLFAATDNNDLDAFTISATGSLAAATTNPKTTTALAFYFSPTVANVTGGMFVYAADANHHHISVIKVANPATCDLLAGNAVTQDFVVPLADLAGLVFAIQVDPSNKFLAAGDSGGHVVVYPIDPGTGNLGARTAAPTTVTTPNVIANLAFATDSSNLYVSQVSGVNVFPFNPSLATPLGAELTAAAVTPAAGGRIIVDRTNTLVYYTSIAGSDVRGFVRNPTTGALSGPIVGTTAAHSALSVALTY